MGVVRSLRGAGRWRFDAYIVMLLVSATIPVVIALITREVVDGLATSASRDRVIAFVAIEAVVVVGGVSLDQALAHVAQYLRFQIIQSIQLRNADQSARLDIAFFDDPKQRDLLHRIRQESYHRPRMLMGSLSAVIMGTVTTLGFFITLATWEPFLSFLFLLGTLPLLVWGQKAAGWSWMSRDRSTPDGRRSAYFEDLLCERETAQEVRLHNVAPMILPRLKAYNEKHRVTEMEGIRAKTVSLIPGRIAGVVAQYAAVGWAVIQVSSGDLSLGQFTLVVAALAICRQILQGLVAEYVEIQESRHYVDELWKSGTCVRRSPRVPRLSPYRT